MPDFLLDNYLQINKKILKSKVIFLFLDYDGTLVFFKDKPNDVKTPKKIKKIINQLVENPRLRVIIVTGRSLVDIKKLMNIKGLSFIALHGLYIETLNGLKYSWEKVDQTRSLIKTIKEDMQKEIIKEKVAFLEDKDLTVVLHYRLLPSNRIKNVREKFQKTVYRNDKKKILEIINGEKVMEARPKGWNKGKAIELFLAQYSYKKNILPIYIGDDVTDEDAFQFLRNKGISIHVANQSKIKSKARYWVKNPDEVFLFLQSLSRLVS